jgi:hypothetical protein
VHRTKLWQRCLRDIGSPGNEEPRDGCIWDNGRRSRTMKYNQEHSPVQAFTRIRVTVAEAGSLRRSVRQVTRHQ